jgi:hypothetical protein
MGGLESQRLHSPQSPGEILRADEPVRNLEAYAELEAAAREINAILSPEQMHFLAPEIQAMLDVRTIEQMRRRELESY